jgi:hypothetical protein
MNAQPPTEAFYNRRLEKALDRQGRLYTLAETISATAVGLGGGKP